MPEYVANSQDIITRRIQELRYEKLRGNQECGKQAGGSSKNCWCIGRGIKGVALPCPVEGERLPPPTETIPL